MISITVRLDPIARGTLRRDALQSRAIWDQNHAFRSAEAAKAEAMAMWSFWTAVLAALDDAEQSPVGNAKP